jgi:TonB family protein
LSLSQHAKHDHDPSAELNRLDLLFAVLLHVLVFTVVSVLAFWQQHPRDEPLKRIEVMMISAKALAKLQQQARPQPKAKPKVRKSKPKPAKVKPAAKAKPVAKAKPKRKSRPKKKAAVRVKDDFDPFAPVSSTTDRKSTPATRTERKPKTTQPELADIAGKQLSDKEKDRYIALVQAAIQEQWKVPASLGDAVDPLVEVRLLSNGEVESISILESSGSSALDASLIRAIRAAAPFQLPARQFEFFRVNRMRFHPLK